MTNTQRFKQYYDEHIRDRVLQDVFDMGVAYGMNEMVARIKDKGNLPPDIEKVLLERLDS